jgi:hypothetical protein
MKISPEQINAIVTAGLVENNRYSDADGLHDAAFDALVNEAPVVAQWKAKQSDEYGGYFVVVRGVPGAYFVQALDHDDIGIFSDLTEAINKAVLVYGEFFTSEG